MNATVLIVEDDPAIRDVLGAILRDEGYAVVCACDGVDGLAKLAEARPQLVLTDLTMPHMDGRVLALTMRGQRRWAAVPILLLSADPAIERTARQVGADGYLPKPFCLPDLLDLVERLTSRDTLPLAA